MNLRKIDVFKVAERIKNIKMKNVFLDNALKFGIPFNMGMGMKIKKITDSESVIDSLPVYRRKNHVGTAHAISQALLIEYAAGLLLGRRYGLEQFRLILTNINITYHKPGKGTLTGSSKAPQEWPDLKDGEMFLSMHTAVHNEKNELVSEGQTTWQIKSWNKTKHQNH